MRSRTIIAALIFLALSAVKFLLPEKTSEIRDAIIPAVTRDVSVRDDIIALGRAMSGGGNYIYVWERWIKSGNEKPEETPPPEVSQPPSPSPSPKASETGSFKLSKIVTQNLLGFEDLVGLTRDVDKAEISEGQDKPTSSNEPLPTPQKPHLQIQLPKIKQQKLNRW